MKKMMILKAIVVESSYLGSSSSKKLKFSIISNSIFIVFFSEFTLFLFPENFQYVRSSDKCHQNENMIDQT